ncbi:Na/Pi symporter [Desertibacillus haloalkaliphilus]|uniref:Na/Pi symporter n=1 Tax=Desertibacillus haloalkaliphilus TaxID=1328930 RepID=UPI001C26553F|nr:Na/Pi symporter [Desertibacillus haloalkaliphilus]MBU8905638.1 Na/Pi symporter [Desertibacillus haloalkaliphilus]
MIQDLFTLFAVFIAVFLFGMTIMRTGLANMTGEKFKKLLLQMTDSPWKGLLVGTIVTAILQSSSAVMIMTVGLVAAGYITFKQSIGIILGTNIGTVLTTEIIAFDLSALIFPLLLLGILFLVINKHLTYCLGCISFGLGCIFVAMQGLEKLAYPLASLPFAHSFFELTNENQLLGVGVGTALSAIIQSSTATTAITMGFMNENMLALHAGIAIMLGANIGTCFTAFLASVGSNHAAKLVAFAHIWLNIIGVLLFLPFVEWLSSISSSLTSIPNLQLAHASTIFNIICSLVVLPFVGWFAKMITKIHGQPSS